MQSRPSSNLLTALICVGAVIHLGLLARLYWLSPLHQHPAWLWQLLFTAVLLTLGCVLWLAYRSHRLHRGIGRLQAHTRLLAEGRLQVWQPDEDLGELSALGSELNRLAQSQQAHTRSQRFTEQRLRDFAGLNADWLWELDEGLNFSYASGRLEAPPGIPGREMVGHSWWEILHRVGVDEHFLQVCKTQFERQLPLEDIETTWRLPPGNHTLLISARPLRDGDGRFVGYRGIGSNITRRREMEQALRASETFSRTVLDSLSANIAVLDHQGVILAVNRPWQNFARENGVEEPATVGEGTNYFQVCQNAEAECPMATEALTGLHAVLAGQERFETIYPCHSPSRKRWFLMRVFPLQQHRRELIVIHVDITDRWLAAEQQNLMTRVFEHTADGILITDAARRIQWVNLAFERITGYSAEEVRGRTPALLRSNQHDAAFYEGIWSSLENTGHWQGEIINRRKDGSLFPEWLRISALRDEKRELSYYVGVFTDITVLRQHEARLAFLAYHDALTKLANRTRFMEALGDAIQRGERYRHFLAVLFIDLDGFKAVNDSHGHEAGDRLLKGVARRLKKGLRRSDIVARLGGDEFAIILDQLKDPRDAATAAGKILGDLSAPIQVNGHTVEVSASIGIACYPRDGTDADTLLKTADTAMYWAKRSGRNRFCFHVDGDPRTGSSEI